MTRTHATQSQTLRSALVSISIGLGAAILVAVVPIPARAQAFSELKAALVDYSKADLEPRKACELLGK